MDMDVMTGLVRPAEEEEAVGLGWEGVGAAGAEKGNRRPLWRRSVPVRISRRKKVRKERRGKTKRKRTAQRRHDLVHLKLVSGFLKRRG